MADLWSNPLRESPKMVRWMLAVAALTTVIIVVVTGYLAGEKPRLSLAAGEGVFERYPFWQASVLRSRELVLDPALARRYSDKFAIPETLGNDPFFVWQPIRTQNVDLELGLGRLAVDGFDK